MVVGQRGDDHPYDEPVHEEFTEQTWGHWPESRAPLKALVVNPLGNWWSYALTIEAALRLTEDGHEVHYLDAAPRQSGELEVNAGDRRSAWRYRQPRAHIASLLRRRGVHWVDIAQTNNRRMASWFPASLDDLRRWRVDGKPSGRIVAAALSGVLQQREFDPHDHEQLVEQHIAAYESGSALMETCMRVMAPDLVVTTNDRLLNAATALSEAREQGIDTLVIYWGNTDTKCVTYQHSLYSAADWRSHIRGAWNAPASSRRHLKLANDTLRAAGDQGLPATADFRSSMVVTDMPKLPNDKKVLAFFPTTPWEYSGLVTRPLGYFEDQVEAVEALLKELDPDEWVLVVRHHPPRDGHRAKPEPGIWDKVRGHPALIEIHANSGVDSYKLLDASTVVAVWVSTIGAEAIARGKPVVVLGEPYWLNHDWGIAAPTQKDIRVQLETPKIMRPEVLLPYLCYFHSYGSPFRYISGKGPDLLRVQGDRVFPRTIAGFAISSLSRVRSKYKH